jgi:ubiquinone/menaquinone biosynthesis C-methylase UbiE
MTRTIRDRRFKLVPEMEGRQARWYAEQRGSGSQLAAYRARAAELSALLPDGGDVLEVAPGPGHLAVELARTGRLTVSGIDVSRTMVEIATGYAAAEGVDVAFRQGDVAELPYPDASFDLVVCQAAFKNFTRPVRALDEIHRVLRPGGTAVVEDMSADATNDAIGREVAGMRLGTANAVVTRSVLRLLRRRAYGRDGFAELARRSAFGAAEVRADGIGLVVTLTKR